MVVKQKSTTGRTLPKHLAKQGRYDLECVKEVIGRKGSGGGSIT